MAGKIECRVVTDPDSLEIRCQLEKRLSVLNVDVLENYNLRPNDLQIIRCVALLSAQLLQELLLVAVSWCFRVEIHRSRPVSGINNDGEFLQSLVKLQLVLYVRYIVCIWLYIFRRVWRVGLSV